MESAAMERATASRASAARHARMATHSGNLLRMCCHYDRVGLQLAYDFLQNESKRHTAHKQITKRSYTHLTYLAYIKTNILTMYNVAKLKVY